ncbi:MltG/YceG/YrrL family protein [Litchfieldia salsa]|uniref:YceG-like family protein n=1 Tax=Litchfieldia salsa TaxID=930152 RepID=A0A1H0VC58_9BACI|nr:hypothetical protein [Litchfieldia salsa]SDP75798.1 hypothetical protein SAMN05216565_106164 [Litchfieldia salsa]
MSRNSLRTFAAGILLATSILAGLYFFQDKEEIPPVVTDEDVKEYLSTRDDIVLIEKEEYEELVQFKEKANEKPVEEEQVQESVEEKVITKYTLEIQSGMNSLEIARLLESVGIITDATQLNNYILEQNLAGKIQIGSYQLTSDMTPQQIADIITK